MTETETTSSRRAAATPTTGGSRCGTETTFCDWKVAREFLAALDDNNEAGVFTFQTFSDNKTLIRTEKHYLGVAPGDVPAKGAKSKKAKLDPNAKVYNCTLSEEFCEHLAQRNREGVGIFVTVNATDLKGRTRDNFRKVRAVWADFDNGLPTSLPLQPSVLVNSSPGRYHAYWFIGDDMPLDIWRAVMVGIVRGYGGDSSVTDPTRVMRLPGTCHMKTGSPHFVAIAESAHNADGFIRLYSAATVKTAFPPANIVTREKAATLPFTSSTRADAERVASALEYISDLPSEDDPRQSNVRNRASWFRVLCALKREYGDAGLPIALDWSKGCHEVYDEEDACAVWTSIKDDTYSGKPFTVGSIIHWAEQAGWTRPGSLGEIHSIASATAGAALPTAGAPVNSNTSAKPTADGSISAIAFGRQVATWTPETSAKMLQLMNEDHAVLLTEGGSVRVLYSKQNAAGLRENRFMRSEDVAALYAHIKFDIEGKKRSAFQAWFEWKDRRQYAGCGMYPFSPKHPAKPPRDYLNLWPGFAIAPKAGDWSLLRAHLRDKICRGNEQHFLWLMDWFAQMIQEPQKKGRSSVVFRSSKKGTGKTMFVRFMRGILGDTVAVANKVEQITGRFNSVLNGNLLLIAEEAVWGGNKTAEGAIKALVTDDTMRIEPKGLEAYDAPNFTRLLILSNNEWVAPVDIHERRWFVADVDHDQANDPNYFGPIFEQMENGGLAAMLNDWLERKITSDLGRPPETDALVKQRAHGLDALHRWLRDVAENEGVLTRDGRQMFNAGKTTILSRDLVKASAREFVKGYEERSLETRLGMLLKDVGVKDGGRIQWGGQPRERAWEFPKIDDFVVAVEARLKITVARD